MSTKTNLDYLYNLYGGEKVAISNIRVLLPYDLENVWNIVVSLDNYKWRSDLSSIEIIEDGKEFVEHTKDGYATEFKITTLMPMSQYAFDMDNANMHGHWVGTFSKEQGGCFIDFTEDVTAKKIIMKPFVKGYLKKQQAIYLADLKKALEQYGK